MVKDHSSEKIALFQYSRDQFCRFLLHSKRFTILVCERSHFLIAILRWNLALCSSLLTFFHETGFSRRLLSFAVIFGTVFLGSLLTIYVRVQWSLSDSFRFLPELCLRGKVFFFLKCCHYCRNNTPSYTK